MGMVSNYVDLRHVLHVRLMIHHQYSDLHVNEPTEDTFPSGSNADCSFFAFFNAQAVYHCNMMRRYIHAILTMKFMQDSKPNANISQI